MIAVVADLSQILLFPLFSEGFASPMNVALDVVVCFALTWLVGWHVAFLPSVVAEVVPLADMAPTWTVAVLFATRGGRMGGRLGEGERDAAALLPTANDD